MNILGLLGAIALTSLTGCSQVNSGVKVLATPKSAIKEITTFDIGVTYQSANSLLRYNLVGSNFISTNADNYVNLYYFEIDNNYNDVSYYGRVNFTPSTTSISTIIDYCNNNTTFGFGVIEDVHYNSLANTIFTYRYLFTLGDDVFDSALGSSYHYFWFQDNNANSLLMAPYDTEHYFDGTEYYEISNVSYPTDLNYINNFGYYPIDYNLEFKYDLRYATLYPFVWYDSYAVNSYAFNMSVAICNLINNSDVESAYSKGYTEGYNAGSDEGYSEGNRDGFQAGTENGISQGYSEGYTDGYEDASELFPDYEQDGYDLGYQQGHTAGYNEGATASNTYTFGTLFASIADTPVLIFRNLFSFDLFGVSALTIILSLFTALLVIFIAKKLIK